MLRIFTPREGARRDDPRAAPAEPGATSVEVPVAFEAVAEALAAGADATTACAVIGHELARSGIDLHAGLSALQATYRQMRAGDPGFAEVQALSLAWSEETLAYLHRLSCEDPLTGLATHAHLRARLSEIYRDAEQRGTDPRRDRVLVVVELVAPVGLDRFDQAVRLAAVTENLRIVFSGGDPICRVGAHRLVVLTHRTAELGRLLAATRDLFAAEGHSVGERARVWSEALPGSVDSAARVLDELSRR